MGCGVNYFLRRLLCRFIRRLSGTHREPVRQWSEADLRAIDHAYGALVGSTIGGIVVAVILLVVVWRPQ